jgi:hypothetical protein
MSRLAPHGPQLALFIKTPNILNTVRQLISCFLLARVGTMTIESVWVAVKNLPKDQDPCWAETIIEEL